MTQIKVVLDLVKYVPCGIQQNQELGNNDRKIISFQHNQELGNNDRKISKQ